MDKRTKRLREIDRLKVWHPFTQMREWMKEDPLIIEKGRGNYLIDTEGNRYLDGVSSLWVTVHGHRKKEIDRAIKEQLSKIAHSTLLGLGNVPSIELAERLVNIAPKGLKRVFYSDDGSTAVEIALKISFQYWEQKQKKNKKKNFIAFTGAYHGDTFGSMSVGEIDIFVKKYRPLLFKAFRSPYPFCYRCPVDKKYPDCNTACLNELEKVLKRHSHETAACIIEPLVQGAAGMITSPPGFLRGVRRLTKKYNVHLIADEVATGFGRTGTMFACEGEGVRPDILCLAKGLTGGYLPLAATLTTEEIFKAFLGNYVEYKSFFHGHTYTGNPLGCAAAIANLEIFEKEKVIEGLKGKCEVFQDLLIGLKDLPCVGDVRCKGLMAGVELVADKKTKRPYAPELRMGRRVCLKAQKKGLIIRPIGDTIIIMPPLSIRKSEIKRIFTTVRDSITEAT
ncbi:MAG: adenosylmethionine--8-amino-7-oxononanoate transaminase [Thermodesulfobacteriota bacterium]|nr:MAG: adenosylmethionine--8-amino-7-oxononanoate transaminase [Thermodesulfobacteriota bacterium]